MIRNFFAVAAALFACGCASPRPISFGMYSVPEAKLAEARSLGIDFVVGGGGGSYIESARRAGLKVIAPAGSNLSDPAILGGILSDEPDLHGISPEEVGRDYKAAKRRTGKPIFLNLSSGYSAEAYVANCDVLMFDWYPVGWMPAETFFSHSRVARLAAEKKPFFAVIQTFDWARYPEAMPAADSHRKPTPAEIKAMTVWAAMNGAKGIVYYPYDDGRARVDDSPEIAAAIKESIALVRNYDWLFESPRLWIAYPFQFQSSADKTNSIAETSIAIRVARTPEDPNTYFIVAANTTDRAIVVKPLVQIDEVAREIRFEPLEVKFLTARAHGRVAGHVY